MEDILKRIEDLVADIRMYAKNGDASSLVLLDERIDSLQQEAANLKEYYGHN